MNLQEFQRKVKEFDFEDIESALKVVRQQYVSCITPEYYSGFLKQLDIAYMERCIPPKASSKKGRVGTAVTHSVRLAEAELQLRIDHLTELKKTTARFSRNVIYQ